MSDNAGREAWLANMRAQCVGGTVADNEQVDVKIDSD